MRRKRIILDNTAQYEFEFDYVVVTDTAGIVGMFMPAINEESFPKGLLTISMYSERFNLHFGKVSGSVIVLGLNQNLASVPKGSFREATKQERFLYEMKKEPLNLGEHQ